MLLFFKGNWASRRGSLRKFWWASPLAEAKRETKPQSLTFLHNHLPWWLLWRHKKHLQAKSKRLFIMNIWSAEGRLSLLSKVYSACFDVLRTFELEWASPRTWVLDERKHKSPINLSWIEHRLSVLSSGKTMKLLVHDKLSSKSEILSTGQW